MPSIQTDATSLQLLFAPASVQINQMSAVPLKCFQVSLHRNGRSARMEAFPENRRNTFKNKLKEIKIKTFQSTISPKQKTHFLTPEQQTHKGTLQAVHPVDCISNYCTTLIFILTPSRFQDDPSSHGCQGSPLSQLATSVHTASISGAGDALLHLLCSHSLLHTQRPHGPKLLRFQADNNSAVHGGICEIADRYLLAKSKSWLNVKDPGRNRA